MEFITGMDLELGSIWVENAQRVKDWEKEIFLWIRERHILNKKKIKIIEYDLWLRAKLFCNLVR